jgi:hypothetical protein
MPRDGSVPYQKIVTGREWVGRVVKHATEPHYVGTMYKGKYSATGATAVAAFEAVVARALGYDSVEQIKSQNRARRAVRREVNAELDRIYDAMMQPGQMTKVLDRAFDNAAPDAAVTVVTQAMLRGLRRDMRRK